MTTINVLTLIYIGIYTTGRSQSYPLQRTQSLAMPEVVPVSRRVRNLNVCGHENMVSLKNYSSVVRAFAHGAMGRRIDPS